MCPSGTLAGMLNLVARRGFISCEVKFFQEFLEKRFTFIKERAIVFSMSTVPLSNDFSPVMANGEGSGPSPQERLLQYEVQKALDLSKRYKEVEITLLDRIEDMVDDDEDLSAASMNALVKSLKELRAIAPAPMVLPQQENKAPQIQIQFLNATQLTIGE